MFKYFKELITEVVEEALDSTNFTNIILSAVVSGTLIAGAITYKINHAQKNAMNNFQNQSFTIQKKIIKRKLEEVVEENLWNFENKNILILHGESGSGKTILCRKLLNKARSEEKLIQICSCQKGGEYFVTGLYEILSLNPDVVGVSNIQAIMDIFNLMLRVPSKAIQEDESKERYHFWKNIATRHFNQKSDKVLILDNFERIYHYDQELFENFLNYSIYLTEHSNLKVLFVSNELEVTLKMKEITKNKNQVFEMENLNFDEMKECCVNSDRLKNLKKEEIEKIFSIGASFPVLKHFDDGIQLFSFEELLKKLENVE
jgi:archaellum biogenesis ATPase FlaH